MEEDRWRYVASLRTGICDHASTAHSNLLYVSGGFKEERFSNSFYAYSPRHDTWHERAPMHVPRGWHSMVTVGDNIVVCGGNAGINKRVDIHETEVYSVLNNQWSIVAPMPLPQSEAGCCFFQNKIFVLGGYSWAHQKCVNTIQSYDPSRDLWERPGSLPIDLSGLRVCLLTIPYSLTQPINTSFGTNTPSARSRGKSMVSHSMRNRSSENQGKFMAGHPPDGVGMPGMPNHVHHHQGGMGNMPNDMWGTADREALGNMQKALQMEAATRQFNQANGGPAPGLNRVGSNFNSIQSQNEYSTLPNNKHY